MSKKEDKKNPLADFFLSVFRVLINAFGIALRILVRAFNFLGLWISLVYVIFGLILYYALNFNPLKINELESQLYISGFVSSALCCCVITLKNIIQKSTNLFRGIFKPIIKSKVSKRETQTIVQGAQKAEKPKIYYSKLEKDTLIHEYRDRFEIFIEKNGIPVLDRIVFKEPL